MSIFHMVNFAENKTISLNYYQFNIPEIINFNNLLKDLLNKNK